MRWGNWAQTELYKTSLLGAQDPILDGTSATGIGTGIGARGSATILQTAGPWNRNLERVKRTNVCQIVLEQVHAIDTELQVNSR